MFFAHGNQTQDAPTLRHFPSTGVILTFFAFPPFSLIPKCTQRILLSGQHRPGARLFCNCYTANRGPSHHQQTSYAMSTSRSHTHFTRACTWWSVLYLVHLRTAKPFSRHYQHLHGFLEERNSKPVQNLCGKMADIL